MSEDGGEERLLAFLMGSLARADSASAWSNTDCSNEERLAVSRPLLEPVAAASGALEKKSNKICNVYICENITRSV